MKQTALLWAKEDGTATRFCLSEPFSLKDTFTCGQCFRFTEKDDGSYFGIAYGRAITIREDGAGEYTITPCTRNEFDAIWRRYFDLDTGYTAIKEAIGWDGHVRRGIDYAPGIRILNQEPFETVISFIISANNNIVRIGRIISALCENYGEPICGGGHTFPTADALARATEEDLRKLGAGYRAGYILRTAKMVADGFDLAAIGELPLLDAQKKLRELSGIGPKVADCILLFSLNHRDAFPVDTWVKKVLVRLYPGCDVRRPHAYSQSRFGPLCGYANQYLFHAIRTMGEEAFCRESCIQ